MTISQIKKFLSAITKEKALNQAQLISAVALGAQGAGKDIKKTIKQIEKSIEDL